MVEKTYIDVDALFQGMRDSVDRLLRKPPQSEVERSEERDQNGARVVQIRAGDAVRPKDSA